METVTTIESNLDNFEVGVFDDESWIETQNYSVEDRDELIKNLKLGGELDLLRKELYDTIQSLVELIKFDLSDIWGRLDKADL